MSTHLQSIPDESIEPAQTLLIEGPDALAFAHAQFSSDVAALAVAHWQFSAWLDAQGRVLALFHLARLDEQRLLLLLRGGDAIAMRDALRRYVFRSRLSLEIPAPFVMHVGPALPLHAASTSGATIAFGCGSYRMQLLPADMPRPMDDHTTDAAWPLAQVRDGWPWLPQALLGKWLPPALSLQRLQAVALNKGCYPGQEIVARMHYRGGNKRHLHRVGLSRVVPAGTLVQVGENESVQLLNVASTQDGAEALAMIHGDIDMHGGAVFAGTIQGEDRTEALRITLLHAWPD